MTKSLRVGARNFIVHYKTHGDEEWFSNQRDDIIKAIGDRYQASTGKGVPIFGVSSAELEQFITTDKDILRKFSRMPAQEFLISEGVDLDESQMSFCDFEEITGDDWVVVKADSKPERPDLVAMNTKEKLARATLDMTSSESIALMTGKDNDKETKLKDFIIKKIIDKGAFGKVFLVENSKDGKLYAMKRLDKNIILQKGQVENIKVEKEILFQADHPFVNSMEYVFQNDLRIYFFLKYVSGGNLYDNLYNVQRFNEDTVRFISAQIACALGYLHTNQIVHRDLKPENVLMDKDGYIMLADFGLAKFLRDKQD